MRATDPGNVFGDQCRHCSPRDRVLAFAEVLRAAGIVTTVRRTRGDDIAAACGQLAGEVQDRTHVRERAARRAQGIHVQRFASPASAKESA